MLGISAAAQFMSAPGQSYSVAIFKDPMRKSLQISETSYALAYGCATIVSGLLLPWVGRAIDRFGARRMLPGIAFFLGLGCLAMSQVGSLTALYFVFSWVRSLGQGALSLIAAWIVGEWFELKKGFATAMSGLGGSISVMCFPLLNGYLIEHYGWQTGWVVLALLVWIVLMIPSAILVRDRPEDLGLHPDGLQRNPSGEPAAVNQELDGIAAPAEPWRVFDVLRDRTFWKLLAVPATSGMVGTGLVFHQMSLMESRGVDGDWARALISLQALIATFAALFAGRLSDRVQNRYLLAAAMGILASAVALIGILPLPILAGFYALLLGLHGSIIRSAGTVVWLTYYGRHNQGAIRGVAMSVMIFGAAAGPLPLAFAIDRYGTYTPALVFFATVPVAAGLLVSTAGPPRDRNGAAI